jgi:hypothetical protein
VSYQGNLNASVPFVDIADREPALDRRLFLFQANSAVAIRHLKGNDHRMRLAESDMSPVVATDADCALGIETVLLFASRVRG